MKRTPVASHGRFVVCGLTFVLAALLLASAAHAAEVTASLLETVRDASGAVVPGATISLTNTQTNVTQKVQTGTDGEYSFTLIPVVLAQGLAGSPNFCPTACSRSASACRPSCA
jgi:hypothetical protein